MKVLFTIFSLFVLLPAYAQTLNQVEHPPRFTVQKTNEKMRLDGVLDEAIWESAAVLNNFSQYSPTDTINALGATEIRMVYSDDVLYVSAKCSSKGNKFIVSSLKRDYSFGGTDNISFVFDTYNDKTNSYLFGMNPYGARREALISNGGKNRAAFDGSWDNKWTGESKMYADYWICELAIPFKILSYQEGAIQWRFNAYRNDTQCNELSIWMNIPREYILMDMNYMGDMVWEEPLGKPSKNIALIPYINTSTTRDYEDDTQSSAKVKFNAGGDAKISLGASLNLDLTGNPDFSQVEVDRQVTNLDRFEIFFPERRQFFLENADLFSGFGNGRMNPFFSRRIGISVDTLTGNNIQNTIYGGARITGKLTDRLRVGMLNMQAAAQQENDLPAFNFSVVAAEQNVFDRSSIAAIFVNKEALNSDRFGDTYSTYDRIAGLEYRLKSKDNFWTAKLSYMKAITPEVSKNEFAHMTQIEYNKRKYRLEWAHVLIGNGFDAEVGFVPRKDIFIMSPEFDLRFFPKSPNIIQHTLSVDARWIYKLGADDNVVLEDFGIEEKGLEISWRTRFLNNYNLSARTEYTDFTLLSDFDPTRVQEEDIFLAAGTSYQNYNFSLGINSDRRNRFNWEIRPRIDRFYEGQRFGFNTRMTYRYTPYGNISLTVNYNHIDLPAPFVTTDLWLIGPRIDLTFSRSHFLTTFIQYNNQVENISVNARYQWRFAPASDLFIVYTDNYNSMDFSSLESRNRGVVLKLTYWLNL